MADQIAQRRNFARPASDELKRKSVRGGFVVVAAQGAKVLLQTGTLILLARLADSGRLRPDRNGRDPYRFSDHVQRCGIERCNRPTP